MIALLALALAQEPVDDPIPPDEEPRPTTEVGKRKWGGLVIPLIGANSTDGFGLGFGGEVFREPLPGESRDLYDLKITASTYFTVNGRLQSHFLQIERRARVSTLVQAGLGRWTNLLFAGNGGDDVSLIRPPEREGDNVMLSPYGMVALTMPVGNVNLFGQAFARGALIDVESDGLLAERAPFGANGGFFVDGAVGVHRDATDRWPLPRDGWQGEASVRVGFGTAGGQVNPIAGPHAEIAWWKSAGRFTLGVRGLASRTFGTQPFFVKELLPGRWRDEVAFEQMLTGYARSRPRGDGVTALLVEARPFIGRAQKGFFDLGFHLSAYAELAYLFDGQDPGPPMPTLGVGPVLVWQEATVLRPFFAWGWRADDPNGPRRPVMQFGVALKDPL